MTEEPALLWGDGAILTRRGCAMVSAALELVARQAASRDGGVRTGDEFEWLRTVVRLAAAGSAPGTAARTFKVIMPGSDRKLATSEVAALAGISQRAVVKAIRAGRLPAARCGQQWVINETDARIFAGGRNGRTQGTNAATGAAARRES